MKYVKRAVLVCGAATLLCWLFSVAAYATGSGDVAGAVESTWAAASGQIKTVVNNVVFPAIDMILAIFFFVNILTIERRASLSGQRRPSCSRVWFLP